VSCGVGERPDGIYLVKYGKRLDMYPVQCITSFSSLYVKSLNHLILKCSLSSLLSVEKTKIDVKNTHKIILCI